jgi:hypothetical protein
MPSKISSSSCSKLAKNLFVEMKHHLPYGIAAVVASMVVLRLAPSSFMQHGHSHCCGGGMFGSFSFFHSLHHLHAIFASATSVMTFRRYSKSLGLAIFGGFFVPPIFCTLSDILLPYIGGNLIGAKMELHLCALQNPLFFTSAALIGIALGLFLSKHSSKNNAGIFHAALASHFLHEFVSALASLAYLGSFGFSGWWNSPVSVFLLMVAAVLIPCTMSDLVMPIVCAKALGIDVSDVSGCAYHEHKCSK